MKIGPDARLEFGRLPAIGEALPKGRYLLSVLTGGKSLFTCRIVLHGGVDLGLCLPEAS